MTPLPSPPPEIEYEAKTRDGWTLKVTRFKPARQVFREPLLCVHGFSQNRKAWTTGRFVPYMMRLGIDVHLVELRGHGKNSVREVRRRGRRPADLDFGWTIDSYLKYDLPAVIARAKEVAGVDKVVYCGHSLGGILGMCLATYSPDLLALATIGSPSDLGSVSFLIRAGTLLTPVLRGIDAALAVESALERGAVRLRRLAGRMRSSGAVGPDPAPLRPREFRAIPMHDFLSFAQRTLGRLQHRASDIVSPDRLGPFTKFWIPYNMRAREIHALLTEGGEPEARGVVAQLARWTRTNQLTSPSLGKNFTREFHRIRIPLALILGDEDFLAPVRASRTIYREARSEYKKRFVYEGSNHLGLTIGHKVEEICYDIKNLVEYAVHHRTKPPTLSRRWSATRALRALGNR